MNHVSNGFRKPLPDDVLLLWSSRWEKAQTGHLFWKLVQNDSFFLFRLGRLMSGRSLNPMSKHKVIVCVLVGEAAVCVIARLSSPWLRRQRIEHTHRESDKNKDLSCTKGTISELNVSTCIADPKIKSYSKWEALFSHSFIYWVSVITACWAQCVSIIELSIQQNLHSH